MPPTRSLLHRDIKPSNILLDDDFAYLIDFGIVRAADETRMTKFGNMIGNVAHRATVKRWGSRGARLTLPSVVVSIPDQGAVLPMSVPPSPEVAGGRRTSPPAREMPRSIVQLTRRRP